MKGKSTNLKKLLHRYFSGCNQILKIEHFKSLFIRWEIKYIIEFHVKMLLDYVKICSPCEWPHSWRFPCLIQQFPPSSDETYSTKNKILFPKLVNFVKYLKNYFAEKIIQKFGVWWKVQLFCTSTALTVA